MPTKIETETQLLRLLSNTPLQIEIELLQTATHTAKNTPKEHMLKFYKTRDEVLKERFDGLIITGAPVELLPYDQIHYWGELKAVMQWAKTNVYSTLYIKRDKLNLLPHADIMSDAIAAYNSFIK